MSPLFGTDRHWEHFGKHHPYFGVLSAPRFLGKQLDRPVREEFYESGEDHVSSVFQTSRQRLDPTFAPQSALDFGCGVGRLLVPLAKRVSQVTGVDVSPSMLGEARGRLDELGIHNVELVLGDDALSGVAGAYDFIHSTLVFQHIPVRRGEAIVQQLLARLNSGGVGMLHFTYAHPNLTGLRGRWQRFCQWFERLKASLRGRPHMQMNDYSLNRLAVMLQQRGVDSVYTQLHDHAGISGASMYFQRDE
jgi:SAM-dependent methyltransferase